MAIKEPAFIDTNIFVYAFMKQSKYFNECRQIVEEAIQGKFIAFISPQILVELYATVTNSKFVTEVLTPQQAEQEIKNLSNSKIIMLYLKDAIVDRVFQLGKKHNIRGKKIYDVQIVSVMIEFGISNLITVNEKDFKTYPEISILNPAMPSL